MAFEPGFSVSQPKADSDLWFIIHEEKPAVKKDGDGCSVPHFSDVKQVQGVLDGAQYFGLKAGQKLDHWGKFIVFIYR